MTSSSGSSYTSSQETTNFARICRIVVDVLRDILWQVLIHEIPAADLPNRVQRNQNQLGNLDVKIKTWLCGISPSSPVIPIAERFDVSSLYTLIRNLCSQVSTPTTQWGKTPPPGGTTLGDDIERVREFRNTLYGHATQAKIDTADFNNLCIDIKNVVSRFDAYFSSKCKAMKCDFESVIDTILTCSMDKSLQDTYIDKMKEIAILSDDLENVKQQVGDVEWQVGDVKQKVGDVERQVGDVKQQVGNVEQQVGDVREQVGNVEQQVGNVKQQIGDVERQVGDLERQVGDVRQQVGGLKQQIEQKVGDVEYQVGDLRQQVGGLKQQIEQQVHDVEHQVGDVRQLVGNVEQQVGGLKHQIEQHVKEQVHDVEQQVGDVRQLVGNVEQQVGGLKHQIEQHVKEQVHDVEQQVGGLKHQIEQKVGDVEYQVGDVRQQVGNVEQQVGGLKQQVGDVKAHLEKEIEEIKETLKKKPDVEEKGKSFRQENDKVEGVHDSLIDEDPASQLEKENIGISHQPSQSTKEKKTDKRKKGDRMLGFPKKQKIGKAAESKKTYNADEIVTFAAQQSSPKRQKMGEVTESKRTNNADEITTSILQQRVSCMDPRLLCQVLNKSVEVASSSLSTLERNCLTAGMKFHGETPRNGNCFFEAVSSQLQRLNCTVQMSPQQLRQDVVTFMKTNRILPVSDGTIDLADFICGNFEEYLLRMAQDGEWADHVVVVGMARMLEININIVTSSPSSGPDCNIALVVGHPNFKGAPILLGHEWENHYWSLQPIEDLQTKEFGLASDGSDQPISGNEVPQQSFQVGEQMSTFETEVSPVLEVYDDPEADRQVIPEEILRMDEGSIQMFKKALTDQKEKVYNVRVMIVGRYGVGKTTLCKRLLGDDVDISKRESTDGIDVHIHRCRVSRATGEWLKEDKDAEEADKVHRYFKLLNNQDQGLDTGDEQAAHSKEIHKTETVHDVKETEIQHVGSTNLGKDQKTLKSPSSKPSNFSSEDQISDEDKRGLKASSKGDKVNSFSNMSKEDLNKMLEQSARNADKSDSKETVKKILQFLTENADKLVRSREEYSPLAMWDFAGQYVYYTTHQTFLTQRAIYLLVIDLTQQFTDHVDDDDYFFDIEGKKECEVHDLVELWLNSIHSCAPSLESGNPPVILVGTHMDKIQKDIPQERSENIFKEIRKRYLKGRPARLHLADQDFSIDNTFVDPKLKDLQKKIVELASQQQHWGESIPARWLLLEERLMSLKANQVKVISYHFLEEMNQDGDVRIESKEELDLFLKFQHDIGNILYFSTKELREWIVLEPQWLIKAMKSLITADMFILRRHPQAEREWHQFEEEGKLTQELLDIVWSKEHDPDLHDYKTLILLLMEQLNIIARPRLLTEDRDKVEDFFLAPCMLRETTAWEIISPEVNPEMESSSTLCFVFTRQFLPSPIFHRLLAVCVAKWPIFKKRGKYQIFCGCCVFEISRLYRLTLYFKSYVIFARITLAAAKHQTFDAKVCIPVREFIDYNLSKILGNLSQNLKFELFIQCQCPDSKGDYLDNMFAAKELSSIATLTCRYHDDRIVESSSLLKYWFQNEVEIYFLAPCMLREAAPEVIFPEPHAEIESSSVLCYVFMEQFLPSFIFHHLVSDCVAHWSIAKKESENQIFSNCCVFNLDLHHRLIVFFRKHVIFAKVIRMKIIEKTLSSKLCVEAKEFITMTLSKIIEYLGEHLQFELSIQCLRSDGFSVNCLIPVADLLANVEVSCRFHNESNFSYKLLQLWFQEEVSKNKYVFQSPCLLKHYVF